MRTVVIGGGIAGLATAWAIREEAARKAEPLEMTVLEAGPRAGGRVRTTHDDGHRIEWAANALQGTDGAAWRLAEAVGLSGERVLARPDAARRYILRRGRLHMIPTSPLGIARFTALSPGGRLRMALEPFFARRVRHEESVHDYAARHVGEEAASVLLGAVVRGVFAGDARQLSLDAAFPAMREMERRHRSLALAWTARRKRSGGPGGRPLWTLKRGMQSLTDALAERLGPSLRLNSPALALERRESGFTIRVASGHQVEADTVALAISSKAAAALVRPFDSELGRLLGSIESAGVAVVALSFRREAFRSAPDGYGYLVVPGEKIPILGALFESNLFPGRAPDGRVLVRAMLGGVDRPELLTRSDADLTGLAMGALDQTHGLSTGPERTWVVRQETSIPQYVVGHTTLMAQIERRLSALGRIHLTGNAYRGVSVTSLAEDAERLATRVVGVTPSYPSSPFPRSPPSGP